MIPPSSNTGGKSPPKAETGVRARTKIDALTFTAKGSLDGPLALLERHLGKSGRFQVEDRKAGFKGYDSSALLAVDGMNVGLIAWGGLSQRGTSYVSVMGTGCALAGDVGLLVAACRREDWSLGRVDIAADFVDGSVTLDTCIAASRRGGFKSRGRPPKIDLQGPIDGSDRGSTMTVGDRKSDKYGRCYEKGLKELPGLVQEVYEETGIDPGGNLRVQVDGRWVDPSKWFRCEAELKASKRPLPWDIVERRDHYFAGCYPYFAEILPHVEPERILSPRKLGQIALEEQLSHIRRQWGSTLFTALVAYEGDMGRLLARIMGEQHNERLVQAGALLREHPQVS